MLFTVLTQAQSDPLRGLVTGVAAVVSLVAALTFHEFSHALAATRLGDPTPRRQGRLSLRPTAHLDPMGTVMLLVAGFGWGKPVVVNPAYLRVGGRRGMAAVALAGPVANVTVAFLLAMPLRLGLVATGRVGFSYFRGDATDLLGYAVGAAVFWNVLLAAFNLIPVAPLDGFKVAVGALPEGASQAFARLERHGPVILVLLVASDYLLGTRILIGVIQPVVDLLTLVVIGGQVS